MSEVEDIDNQVLQALGKIPHKKTLKFYLELNLKNFQERRNGKVLG